MCRETRFALLMFRVVPFRVAWHCRYYYNWKTAACLWLDPTKAPTSDLSKESKRWIVRMDPATKRVFYYNHATATSAWDKPTDPEATVARVTKWAALIDPASRGVFYIQTATGRLQWHKPAAFDGDMPLGQP